MKPLYVWSTVVGIVIGSTLGYLAYHQELEDNYPKPNILILSLCSLRKAEMDIFSKSSGPSITPNIDKAFKNGLALDNVYSSFGWTNLALYFLKAFDEKFLVGNGYDVIDDDWRPLRVSVLGDFNDGQPEQFVNHIHPKLNFLNSRIGLYRSRPFFAFVHIKYMHYPYKDKINEDSGWDKYLTEEEKQHVAKMLSTPEILKEKIPFALKLAGDPSFLDLMPEFKPPEQDPLKIFFGMYNLLIDNTFLTRWTKQPDYKKDLEILRKVYRAKLNKLDDVLADVLNLYGRKDLLDNTILVLMGDHGESFMEHGYLGHAMHVYDEILTPPVLMRFPRKWRMKTEHLGQQIHMGSLVDWLMDTVRGDNREKHFKDSLSNNPKNKYVVSRNCSNNIHSVRFDNQWKFIHDRINREKMLFDLQKDPQESVNVYEQNPKVAADLELYLAANMSEVDQIVDLTPCQL